MSNRFYRASLLATTMIAGLAAPAFAQTTPPPPSDAAEQPGTQEEELGVQSQDTAPAAESEGGEIVVTGTLIRNPNLTSSSPVAVVGEEEINLRSTGSAEQIIREIPGVVPNLGGNVNNGTVGAARVDLRGLGANRNLVMLDSTRLVPASFFGAVDLNNIPLALVDRVDVLTGGASTTYGADAVTGVVNFITKKNFAGLDLRLGTGITEQGDGMTFRADLVLGANFDDGRGNAVLALGYMETDEVFFGDRPIGQCVINSFSGFCGGDSPTATPTSFALGPTRNALIGFGPGNLQVGTGAGNALVPQYAVFNFNPFNIYQVPFERYNVYSAAHYDVTDDITIYGRGLFSKNITSSIIAPSGVFGENLTVPGWNPFLTPQQRDQLCTANGIALGAACNTAAAIPLGAVYRRTTEVGPRISEYTTNIFDMKAGFTWNFTENMSLDLYGAYGESENREVRQNYVARSRLQQALNVSQTDPTVCTNPANGCVPLNLFGPPGSITPEMAGFIGGITSSIVNKATLSQVHGVVSGDFGYSLPWASEAIAFAVGGEQRVYGAARQPDNLAQVPGELGGAGGAILPLEGGYTARDAFGELIIPIAQDKPFMHSLQLDAGIRRSWYSVDAEGDPSFTATTWKVGAEWAPIEAIKFRGSYQKPVRAPNIGELFAPVTTGLTNLASDPCAGTLNPANVTATLPLNPNLSNPNLVAVCLAQGAPAGSIGGIENPAAGQANATGGGNPALEPESAKTWTIGVVINPRSILPGFNATIDYYNIRVKDAITAPLPGDIIAACFGGPTGATVTPGAATDPACTGIRRNPANGRLSGSPATTPGLPTPLTNAGELFTDGVDFTANYKTGVGFADLLFNLAGNWTRSAKFAASPSAGFGPNCPGVFSVNCGIAVGQLQPEWSWNFRTTLAFKNVDVSLLWRHISGFEYQDDLPPLFDGTITGGGPLAGDSDDFNSIPAYNYFDLTTRFDIADHYELTLGVFNLLDKQPPVVGGNAGSTTANSGNTFPSTYDVLGRRYTASVRVKF